MMGLFTLLRMIILKNRLLAKNEFLEEPEAIELVYPENQVQFCVIYMVRNSLRFVPWNDESALKFFYLALEEYI
jgi:transposase-like protein